MMRAPMIAELRENRRIADGGGERESGIGFRVSGVLGIGYWVLGIGY